MTTLTYNGITLEVQRVLSYKREAVWAGNSYLHSRHLITVTPLFNPAWNAVLINGAGVVSASRVGTAIGGGPAGALPARTDLAVRHLLMQPRKSLKLTVGTNDILVSPDAGKAVDCSNGPKPIECEVQAM